MDISGSGPGNVFFNPYSPSIENEEEIRSKALFDALSSGDLERIRHLLSTAEIDYWGDLFITALENNHPEIALFLFQHENSDIDSDILEDSVSDAIHSGHFPLIEALLNAVEEISEEYLGPAVVAAASSNYLEPLCRLLEKGSISEEAKSDAVSITLDKGYEKTTEILLKTGAKIPPECLHRNIVAAAQNSRIDILQIVLRYTSINIKTRDQALQVVAGPNAEEIKIVLNRLQSSASRLIEHPDQALILFDKKETFRSTLALETVYGHHITINITKELVVGLVNALLRKNILVLGDEIKIPLIRENEAEIEQHYRRFGKFLSLLFVKNQMHRPSEKIFIGTFLNPHFFHLLKILNEGREDTDRRMVGALGEVNRSMRRSAQDILSSSVPLEENPEFIQEFLPFCNGARAIFSGMTDKMKEEIEQLSFEELSTSIQGDNSENTLTDTFNSISLE